MKSLLLAALPALLVFGPYVQAQEPPKYEMTNYVVGFLYKGPKWTAESTEETRKIQQGHMANIKRMAETGKLIVAGPFTDNGDLRGMYIFQGVSMEQAREMVDADPAIQAGRMIVRLHPWFAGKGLNVPPPGKQ
jgi:uncharacterized protein YciI